MPLAGAAARLARHVEARRAVLLRGVRHLSRLVLADRGRRDGGVRRDPDRVRHARDGLARPGRLPARDGLHHRAIFFIVVGAFIFSRFIVLTQFPNELDRVGAGAGLSPFWILMAVMALYVLLGTFLDEVSTILITVPVTLPLVTASATTASGSASSSP